jgi:enoyl-CoA hydratase
MNVPEQRSDTLRRMSTTYTLADDVATITLDDGKVNALGPDMQATLMADLDRAEADGAIVVLTGRERILSAGFDLRAPAEAWQGMVAGGARLAERLLAFPRPTVVACNGSAVAMGAMVLLAADVRIGVGGEHRIGLNEVAIGLTLPWFAIALAQHRLTRPAADHAAVTGQLLGPEEAREAGYLDVVAEDLPAATAEAVAALKRVDADAHARTKLRIREAVLAGVRDGIARIEGRDVSEW